MPSQADAAAHLDLSPVRLRALIREGVLPAQRRGDFDVDELRIAYIRYLRKRSVGRPSAAALGGAPGDNELLEVKLRIERARAAEIEQRAAERAGHLIELAAVIAHNTQVLQAVNQAVMSLPARIAPLCIGVTSERDIKAIAEEECRAALGAAAELVRGIGEGIDPASTADPERVG